tara:strand:+ start:455 stop:994 length:540 start_codon:yes stop_codon:yes gene_type:complete
MAINVQAIAGAYYGTYAGNYVGITEDGFEIEQTTYTEPIRGDNMGDSIQDEVYRGADVFVNFVLIEYNKAVAATGGTDGTPIFHPHDDANGQVGKPGVLRGAFSAGALVLTEYSGDTTSDPTTYTFTKACLASNFPVRLLLANRLRKIPLRLQAYPVLDSGIGTSAAYTAVPSAKWFVT